MSNPKHMGDLLDCLDDVVKKVQMEVVEREKSSGTLCWIIQKKERENAFLTEEVSNLTEEVSNLREKVDQHWYYKNGLMP